MHFFNPAPVMPLVEIVAGLLTSDETSQALSDLAIAWGKTAVTSKDAPGFIVNRGARPFYGEPLKFVEERGADIATTDALVKSVGFRMGPMELIDLVGLDINLAASHSSWNSYYAEARYKPSSLVEEKVAAGQFGKKSGRGFYSYPPTEDAAPKTAPSKKGPQEVAVHGDIGPATPLFQLSRSKGVEIDRAQGDGWMMLEGLKLALTDGRMAAERGQGWVVFDLALDWEKTNLVALSAAANTDPSLAIGYFQALGKDVCVIEDLPGMLGAKTICMLINEACETLLREIANKEDIDLAMKKGLNFPGGPFEWADALGLDYVLRVLDNMERSYNDPRYRASILLRRMALNGEKFY
jgi:3-hydroxybutyryl-CoA dehydrogenase